MLSVTLIYIIRFSLCFHQFIVTLYTVFQKSQALFEISFAILINDLQKEQKKAKKCPFDAILGAKQPT
jgi:hypothetical protein